MPKVVVAMSGGVDSSVAAMLLKREGYEVIGVTMLVQPVDESQEEKASFNVCCGINDITDAQRAAHQLDIPHYVMNFQDIFSRKVIADFCREYSRGRTPNPCIRCNQYIKFGALLDRARELEADFVATGHYARIEEANGQYLLRRGRDVTKDQSYALYTLTREQLRYTLMPLGNLTKENVRRIAHEARLVIAEKPESQEICFVPDNDYPRFLMESIAGVVEPGLIINREGAVLGEHRGIIYYTVGQRHGLGIAAREPLYVIAIDADRNAVVVGPRSETFGAELVAIEVNWITIEKPEQPIVVRAQIRYRHQAAKATVIPLRDTESRVIFEEPQMAITPGQAVVFYDGDVVLGGGTIDRLVSY